MILSGKSVHSAKWIHGGDSVAIRQRALDIGLAGAGLLVFAVPMLAIALLVWVDGGRPVLFPQRRLGQRGRRFSMYKFRKFRTGGVESGAAVTVTNDCRLSGIGKILALTKCDELPQLWNVLKGDMSIVGPRPEVEAFANCFEGPYRGILEFRPGIFGPNQVFFRNEAALYPPDRDPEEYYRTVLFPLKGRVDLAYFQNRSIGQDIVWIIRSVFAVFWLKARHRGDLRIVDKVDDWILKHNQAVPRVIRVLQDI